MPGLDENAKISSKNTIESETDRFRKIAKAK